MVMASYTLRREWAGVSRGYDEVTVEASSFEEALETAEDTCKYEREVVRDDTFCEEWEEW
jgi:hypothetical protein